MGNINPKKMKYTSIFVVAMLMSTSSGISLEKEATGVSEGTQKIIDESVNDVMKSVSQTEGKAESSADAGSEKVVVTGNKRVITSPYGSPYVTHPYAAHPYYPTVVPVPRPVAVPYYVPKAVVPAATAPNSSVMKAIADANEAAAADKVKDQRDVA